MPELSDRFSIFHGLRQVHLVSVSWSKVASQGVAIYFTELLRSPTMGSSLIGRMVELSHIQVRCERDNLMGCLRHGTC